MLDELTIGIEEEYQIIDPDSRELTSYIQEFLQQGRIVLRDQVKPEFMQSQVEVGSYVCRNIKEARQEVIRLRSMVAEVAQKNGRKIVAAGTHPFSKWVEQDITQNPRYMTLIADMKDLARRLLIFGMHVHVGIPNDALRMDVMNQVRYFLPHILTLSTSSPFWHGRNTGLKSYRSVVFEDLPRTGIPDYFNSFDAYKRFVNTLVKTRCIEEPTKIWWDVRPHPKFPTLEFRVCDCITRIDDVIAVAALIQAVVAKLIQLRQNNVTWRIYRRELIAENKWRAIRDGIEGELIDFGKEESVPLRLLMEELLELVADVSEQLGTQEELAHIRTILRRGTSAEQQLAVYAETGSLEAVVDMLAEATLEGC
ncbi:MAG: carboxylate-amine ligase [Caldilineae bacterium]|nr:MAG: carboxylate-amine ligase [Caldilineae bacterium]